MALSQQHWLPIVPVAARAGGFGDSMMSLCIDLGRGFFCLTPGGRGLMTMSMSSISFSCFFLIYSFLINSRLAFSSSFFTRSSSAFILIKEAEISCITSKDNDFYKPFKIPLNTENIGNYYIILLRIVILLHVNEKNSSPALKKPPFCAILAQINNRVIYWINAEHIKT